MSDALVIKDVVADIEPGADDADSPHGTFDVILSAPVRDRDGETVLPDEWEPLPDHITFDVDHRMSVEGTVGSGVPSIDDAGNLRVRGRYASTPLAQSTRALVNDKHIRHTSVAFLRKSGEKGGKPRRELLNGAFVAVPANVSAIVLDSKAVKEGRRHSSTDAAHVQSIHDAATALGAACSGPSEKDAADLPGLRAKLATVDTKALPDVVRAVLIALGVMEDPEDEKPSAATEATEGSADAEPSAADAAADRAAALSVRARQIRAMSALHSHREVDHAHTA